LATQAQTEALLRRMRDMSAADLSVLAASADTPGSNMTTAPGSRNDALWSDMEKLGWLTVKSETLDLPGGKQYLMKIYAIAAEGREPILTLLSALSVGHGC
jgi:hypothetical protein